MSEMQMNENQSAVNQAVGSQAEKRVLKEEKKSGMQISDLLLAAILLAAGAVLKFFIGSIVNIGGMKPNFIIAMYCMAILLIKPRLYEAAIIGLIAGAVCQFFPGSPYLNFASEFAGAVVMALLIKVPMKIGKVNLKPAVATFVSTVVSGGLFTVLLFVVLGAAKETMVAYVPIVLCTALINSIIVQLLVVPLKKITNR